MAADSSGNAYVAGGFSESTVSFGGITLTNLGHGDAFVAKYDVAGILLWVRQGGVVAGGQASIIDMALDGAGNTYVVGRFRGDLNFGGSNIISVDINAANYGFFMAKFSSSGSLQWMRQLGGTNFVFASEIAVDGAGNAYVAGQFDSACVFDTTILTSFGLVDTFLAKYDTDGGLVWVRQAGGTSYEYPTALAVDKAGNCYVAGDFRQTISFGTTNLVSTGTRNNFLAKYNANGEVEWAQKAEGDGYSEIPAATADAFGNLYIAGYFVSNVTFGASSVMSRGGQDAFVAKFSSNGVMQWFQSAGESNRYAFTSDVAVNSAGAVFISGSFGSVSRSFEASIFFETTRLISAGYWDAFFAQYSNDGALRSVGRGMIVAIASRRTVTTTFSWLGLSLAQ